jgi:membrane protein DedA with SNARE-associated domain
MFLQIMLSIFSVTVGTVTALISQYGYLAIFVLMVLEAAAFPIPSEVVLPAVGYLVAKGVVNPIIGFSAVIAGGIIGMTVDYYIAYFLGKDVVYKHLSFFHIKKEQLQNFDTWFASHGPFAVFVTRLVPLVRALINFPAGFAEMPIGRFLLFSISGTIIWDILLIAFGYYALAVNSVDIVAVSLAAFVLVLYVIYRYVMSHVK